jgi:hypothetical protein
MWVGLLAIQFVLQRLVKGPGEVEARIAPKQLAHCQTTLLSGTLRSARMSYVPERYWEGVLKFYSNGVRHE